MSYHKLPTINKTYLSECLRFSCPHCKKAFFILPSRWNLHLEECLEGLTFDKLVLLRKEALDVITRQGIELLMMRGHHNSIIN